MTAAPVLTAPPLPATSPAEKLTLAVVAGGLLALLLALADANPGRQTTWFYLALGLISAGTLAWSWLKYGQHPAGVQQDNLWLRDSTGRGAIAWVTGLVLTGFYVVLYWFSNNDGQGNFGPLNNLVHSLDGFSQWLRARPADQWFLYGTFYTLAILLMGGRALWKYRHSRYQLIRTASVMFFQLGFAFLIPGVLQFFQQPEYYFTYFWPLKYDYLFPGTVTALVKDGGLGVFMVFWGGMMSLLATPVLTYFLGKRWYCSWVCGCGGLAETAGDPYRHLSDKSRTAWRWEVRIIYTVLGAIIIITALLWTHFATGGALLGAAGTVAAKGYGFAIGAVFSGVIGVGFYPLMGSPWRPTWACCKSTSPASASAPTARNAFPAATAPTCAKWASMCNSTPSAASPSSGPRAWAAACAARPAPAAYSTWKMARVKAGIKPHRLFTPTHCGF
jgi:hypothetical protein